MTYVFALYFEEKITSSQSSTPTSSIGISKYYSLSIDGRDNVINDLVFSSSSINFKFKNSSNSNSNSNSNKNNGNKYEINTTDRYMIYDIIGELRNDGWLLLSVSSSNNGNKEKYLFEYNDNDNNDNDNDAINDTNDIKKTTNNKSVFHSIKTIFSTTKNSNSKHTNSNSSSNNSSNSKHTNSNNSSNSNSNVKKHKNDNKDKGKQTSLSISLDDDINILRDQYNTSSIEHNIDIQTDNYEDKSVDDISNAPLSSNSTSSHLPNHQKRTTTFEPDISPISPRKKIQQQLYALGNKGNPSPKTISSAAHPNRVVNSTKKPATGSVSPQRTKPSNKSNQDITPTRTSKNTSNTVATPAGARAILRKSEKEPPLVLSELPKKKYDLSVNLGSVQENFILKDLNGRDDHSRLDILWS